VEQTEKKRFCAQSQVAVKVRGGTSSLTLTGSSDYTKQLADNRMQWMWYIHTARLQ
jgi:hypothetical protein